jgi:hypothetical protein
LFCLASAFQASGRSLSDHGHSRTSRKQGVAAAGDLRGQKERSIALAMRKPSQEKSAHRQKLPAGPVGNRTHAARPQSPPRQANGHSSIQPAPPKSAVTHKADELRRRVSLR